MKVPCAKPWTNMSSYWMKNGESNQSPYGIDSMVRFCTGDIQAKKRKKRREKELPIDQQ